MEDVAAFVFASGGVVGLAELARFFASHADVERAFYAAATPVRQLKKIFHHFGPAHGLCWVDAPASGGPTIVHALTPAQRVVFARTRVVQQIPHCLDTLESFLGETPRHRIKIHELARFHTAFVQETAFMRGRSGSILEFLMAYDANATRFGVSDSELWLVKSTRSHRRGSRSSVSSAATASIRSSPGSSSSSEADTQEDHEPHEMVSSSKPATRVQPISVSHALRALQTMWTTVTQLRVFRSSFSLPVSELLVEVCRLVQRNATPTKRPRKTKLKRSSSQAPRSPASVPSPPSPPPLRRLLVPSVAQGLTWKWVAKGSA